MSVQYQIEYDDGGSQQSQASQNLPVQSRPHYVEAIDEPRRRFQIPSILKTASVFALGALALASAERYAPDTWRPSTVIGTYDARIASAVKAAELNQQARFDVWAAQVKIASDQNAEAYRAAMTATNNNYEAVYARARIYAEAATRMQGEYARMRMNQVNVQTGAENGIINMVKMFGYGMNALEAGSGDQALAYSENMSRDVSNRMTQAAIEGARIDVTGWDTNLPSPESVRTELRRYQPVPIPPPPVLSEQPIIMGGKTEVRGGRFCTGMNTFMSVHRQTLEADHAARARQRARDMQQAMRDAAPSNALGNGRLASLHDVNASGLFDNDGIFLGGLDSHLLFFGGDGPLLTYARTGAGKGRDLILPNLGHLRNCSLIVCDPKDGENAFVAAAYRRDVLQQKVVFLNPFEINGDQFPNTRVNPFHLLIDVVRSGQRIDTEASEIAHILLPRAMNQVGGEEWVRNGAIRLTATVLEYLAIFDPENCIPSRLWSFANSGGFDLGAQFAMMETCGVPSIEGRAASFNLVRHDAPKQWEAYKSALCDALEPFAPDSALADATSAHEFDFRTLKHEATTVFKILPSEKLAVGAPWMSLTTNYEIETIAKERGPLKTIFILDEFAQLPPINAVPKATRLYRSKGIQLWFFAQGRFSLRERWPEVLAKEFEDQAAVVTMRSISEPDLIRDISLWSGNATILNRGVSHNGGTVETAAANLGEQKRSVLQAEDILGLGLTKQIIKVATMPHLIVSDCVPFYAVDPWNQLGDVRALHKGFL